MKMVFNAEEQQIINRIKEVFEGKKAVPYLVGGYVRNKLLGLTPKDFDIASVMMPEDIVRAGKEHGLDYAGMVNEKLGTVLLIIDGVKIEHTTFRKESYSPGGTHSPEEVSIGVTMEEDAFRRDFSINALYVDLNTSEILDPTGRGLEDIKVKQIRSTTEDPEVIIKDDALRLLRLVRFACQLEFMIDKDLFEKAKDYSSQIRVVSRERLAGELDKIFLADLDYKIERRYKNGMRALILLENLGLIDYLIPEFNGYKRVGYGSYHKYSVYMHTAHVLSLVPCDKVLKYAALFHDVGKPSVWKETGKMYGHDVLGKEIAYNRMIELGHDKKTSQEVSVLVREHMYDLRGDAKEAKIRRKIQKMGYELFEKLIALRRADFLGSGMEKEPVKSADKLQSIMDRMKAEKAPMNLRELDIDGNDLIKEFGIKGSLIGDVLDELLYRCALKPSDNRKSILLREAGNILRNLNKKN